MKSEMQILRFYLVGQSKISVAIICDMIKQNRSEVSKQHVIDFLSFAAVKCI